MTKPIKVAFVGNFPDGKALLDKVTSAGFEISLMEEADVLVVGGGDGTILETTGKLASKKIDLNPVVIGYNSGHVGFLSNDIGDETLLAILGDLRLYWPSHPAIQHRRLLKATVETSRFALNEVVIQPDERGKLFEVSVSINGRSPVMFKGDGIIISTSTGSTAYNLSAGGPILMPDLEAIAITPICPYSMSARTLVLPTRWLELKVLPQKPSFITVDGVAWRYDEPTELNICMAERPLKLVKTVDFIDSAADKLGWNYQIKG